MLLRHARIRLAVSAGVGTAIGVVLAFLLPWQLAVMIGWDAAAAVMVAWVFLAVLPLDSDKTAKVAKREDNSRFISDVVLVAACLASLVGVGFALVKSNSEKGVVGVALTVVAVLTVVLAWTVVHTIYMLHYARLYYTVSGCIDFNGDDTPDYRDFAYLAFTIGMTYQVSDTDLKSKTLRRTATHHALLSYLFGTVVVAMTINVVASLVK